MPEIVPGKVYILKVPTPVRALELQGYTVLVRLPDGRTQQVDPNHIWRKRMPTNEQRAVAADQALRRHKEVSDGQAADWNDDDLVDLLTNLLHLQSRHTRHGPGVVEFWFDQQVRLAKLHFEAECREESDNQEKTDAAPHL